MGSALLGGAKINCAIQWLSYQSENGFFFIPHSTRWMTFAGGDGSKQQQQHKEKLN